jgi:two-component system, chemotaxis family, chemotaxis protein CheY
MRALIVDDSRAMRMILGKILKDIGFDITEATHGKDALAKLREMIVAPDVMLVDWNMPEMNGFELVSAVRADSTWDATRIMMVTTEADLSNVSKALGAGADEYMMKPFTKESVVEKLGLLGLST